MSILVTGGAGYIGSHTVYALFEAGQRDVIVLDNLSVGHRASVHPDAKFYHADIRDRAALDAIFAKENIEGVIHFAASSQVNESMQKPLKYYENNLSGTTTLLQAMVNAEVAHIVFSSTAAVYGELTQTPIREDAPAVPTSCYGETKLAMERMMHWTSHAHKLSYVSLRYFNASGAHESGKIGEDHRPETHLLPNVLKVPNGQLPHVSVFGNDYPTKDGTCVRDYIHVMDLASAHVLAMDYLLNGGESVVLNLGNGVGFTVAEVIETARQVTGHAIPAKIESRRAGDPATLVASSEKTRTVLGWNPVCADLHTIVESAWKWHKTNPNGFAG